MSPGEGGKGIHAPSKKLKMKKKTNHMARKELNVNLLRFFG